MATRSERTTTRENKDRDQKSRARWAKDFANRIDRAVKRSFSSWYRFAEADQVLKDAAYKWCNPPLAKSEKGRGKPDWTRAHQPRAQSLARFCELTRSNAEYLITGHGPPVRGVDRTPQSLLDDLLEVVRAPSNDADDVVDEFEWTIDVEALIAEMRRLVRVEVAEWRDWYARWRTLVSIPGQPYREFVDMIMDFDGRADGTNAEERQGVQLDNLAATVVAASEAARPRTRFVQRPLGDWTVVIEKEELDRLRNEAKAVRHEARHPPLSLRLSGPFNARECRS
jgi:hypothetical protein